MSVTKLDVMSDEWRSESRSQGCRSFSMVYNSATVIKPSMVDN